MRNSFDIEKQVQFAIFFAFIKGTALNSIDNCWDVNIINKVNSSSKCNTFLGEHLGLLRMDAVRRIALNLSLREWLEAATAPPLVQRMGLSPAIAAGVAGLPSTFPRDPADRIIVATAQILGATLLTHDSRIIDAKLVPVLI